MGGLGYLQFREVLASLADGGRAYNYRTEVVINSDDCWLSTWANDNLYVIVQASVADAALNRTLLDVHAGGAYGMQPDGEVFYSLATASWRFDYGGPWARVHEGGVAFGWRSRLPSELFGEANLSDAFGFVLGMVDAFGQAAAVLSEELIPRFGGFRCLDRDPNAWPALLGGLLPPE